MATVLDALTALAESGLPLSVLEVGAGHGAFTEPLLAAGAEVTASEMSRPSISYLEGRYRHNPHFRAVFDPDGSLALLEGQRFSFVLCSSVLHHIPDYLAFLHGVTTKHMYAGGTLLSLQDPLWYPTVGRATHRLDRACYLVWRLSRGNYRVGMQTVSRRLRHQLDENDPSDMVEYHVVRQGLDQEEIRRRLSESFLEVSVSPYWSTQAAVLQKIGERMFRPNTFLLLASGRRVP
ncbi:MAG TPA: methyltransferase [Acidimicrobiales bacterium]|nr:methyltransferase [Acidimicrobiales bacterium]